MCLRKFSMDGKIEAGPFSTDEKSSCLMTYGEAIRDATATAMRRRPEVLIFGEGITDSGSVFGTTAGLLQEFGPRRVIETPLSEAAITGICTGAAIAGLRPILVHQRIDFALLGMDQLVNHAAKWRYMYAGKFKVPLVIRCLVGKGWGQAAQHSQSLQALFAHIPGLKVVMPSTPHDAKGMLLAAIEDENPVVFIEGRSLYTLSEEVPAGYFSETLGAGVIRRKGSDLTLIGVSHLMPELLKAADNLRGEMDIEVIDLRSVSPLPVELLVGSVRRTGLAMVVDTGWKKFGIGAEISSLLHERCFAELKLPVERVGLPDSSTPCSSVLERLYYPSAPHLEQRLRDFVPLVKQQPLPRQPPG